MEVDSDVVIAMASLAETNPYLRDPKRRREMIERVTYESSVFEGASPRALRSAAKPARKARSKKRSSSA